MKDMVRDSQAVGVARERMLGENRSKKEKLRGEITMGSGTDGLTRLIRLRLWLVKHAYECSVFLSALSCPGLQTARVADHVTPAFRTKAVAALYAHASVFEPAGSSKFRSISVGW